MMRDIKFRAWDGEKMIKDIHRHSDFNFHCMGNYKGYALEQFTGLQDKNGVDIFEGDILAESDRPIDEATPRRWEVKWSNTPYSAYFDFGYMSPSHYCEVIGNIHENKELLEKE